MHTLRQFHRYFLEESAFARDLVFLLLLPAECERCTGDEGGRQRALDFAWDCWRQALPARLRRKADCCGRIATVSLKHQAALRGKTLRTRSLGKRSFFQNLCLTSGSAEGLFALHVALRPRTLQSSRSTSRGPSNRGRVVLRHTPLSALAARVI